MPPDQLALSPADSDAVRQLAQRTGRAETDLLHEAVAALMRQATLENWQAALRRAKGMWADHPEAPDVQQLRGEWEHRAERLAGQDHD